MGHVASNDFNLLTPSDIWDGLAYSETKNFKCIISKSNVAARLKRAEAERGNDINTERLFMISLSICIRSQG